MNRNGSTETVHLECYTDRELISGFVRCPSDMRLLDALNGRENTNGSEYVRILDTSDAAGVQADCDDRDVYVKKSSVLFVAIFDADTRRGAGARRGTTSYPYVSKYPVRASLRLRNFTLTGTIHRCLGQTIEGVLNEGSRFLPLTGVTVSREDQVCEQRSFVAVNREHIVWSRKQT